MRVGKYEGEGGMMEQSSELIAHSPIVQKVEDRSSLHSQRNYDGARKGFRL